MVMNKRGQAFLMAAIIIAGLVLGAVKVANTARADNNAGAWVDLGNEVDFETKKVLDFGVINPGDVAFTPPFDQDDVINFLSRYNEYISGQEVVFIWGDASGANYYAITYHVDPSGAVSLYTNSAGTPISLLISVITTTTANVNVDVVAKTLTVRIRGIDYSFNLKPGQNFYFVLIKDENGEKFVAKK